MLCFYVLTDAIVYGAVRVINALAYYVGRSLVNESVRRDDRSLKLVKQFKCMQTGTIRGSLSDVEFVGHSLH